MVRDEVLFVLGWGFVIGIGGGFGGGFLLLVFEGFCDGDVLEVAQGDLLQLWSGGNIRIIVCNTFAKRLFLTTLPQTIRIGINPRLLHLIYLILLINLPPPPNIIHITLAPPPRISRTLNL